MELCGSLHKLGMFVLYLVHFCGYFKTIAGGDVCSCRQKNQQYNCDLCLPTGSCSKINFALGKPARASSLYNNAKYGMSGPACLAVNGNTNTDFVSVNDSSTNPVWVHTAEGDNSPYWEVDLGQEYITSTITVYGRSESNRNLMRNASVSVDDKLCYTFAAGYFQPVITNITCDPPLTGRKVKILKSYDIYNALFVAVCQVQVWGCNSGYYGSSCTNICGNCSTGTCEPTSGECPQGCKPGFQAPYCNKSSTPCNIYDGRCEKGCAAGYRQLPFCKEGTFGPDCKYACGNCTDGTTCSATTGECPNGCKAGCSEKYCNETCSNSTHGPSCNERCGKCLEGSPCNIYDSSCDSECVAGYKPPLCKADTDCQNECASTVGPIAGAVTGSIAGCAIGFLLGVLFMRCRLHQPSNSRASAARFPPSSQSEFSSSPPEESRPPRPDSEDYELPSQPANVYDSLKDVRDDNVYTKLNAAKGKGVM